MGRKRTKFSDASEVYHIRLSKESHDYITSMGDLGPDLVRSLIDEHRRNRDGRFLDHQIEEARALVMRLKTELLEAEKAVNNLEGAKAKMLESQLKYLEVRQKLFDEYLHNPQYFRGWLEAREELITEAKFDSAKEVAEFCRAECVKRGYKV